MTYYENDSDLFEYDPESELKTENPTFSSEQDSVESALLSSGLEFLKAKTAISFLQAQGFWFDAPLLEASSTNKAAHVILDELSAGKFSLLKIYFDVESNLSRKRDILHIIKKFYNTISTSEEKVIKIKLQDSDFELDLTILQSFILNNVRIITHACINLRAIYSSLSEQLGFEINQDLMEHHSMEIQDPDSNFLEDDDLMKHLLSQIFDKSYSSDYKSYLTDVYSQIYNSLSQAGLIDLIKSMTSFSGDIEIC
jgi:hypothetical protein